MTETVTFPLKRRALLRTAPTAIALTFRVLCETCRVEVRGQEHLDEFERAYGHVIFAFWHEVVGVAAWYHRNRGYYTLTSQSFDGELAARTVERFGFNVVRGSSSRGGAAAIGRLQEALEGSPGFGFTVDGPKGPRRVAKPGIAYLSARTGVPVLPHAFSARPAWRLNSWDRMLIPKPFGRIVCAYGPPVPPAPDRSREAVEAARQRIEEAVNGLHAELEREA
jgi:lysophospholipid acyltransferase (LPLAT)-like uncharacterized protein